MSAQNPISPKAVASTGGAGLGAAIATLVTWILGVTLWDASSAAGNVAEAMASVPTPVSGVIILVIPAAVAAISGWLTTDPHRVTTDQLQILREAENGTA
ncbi:MAG: hypothetical protein ABWX74_13900 [Aeromicrobium sp.]